MTKKTKISFDAWISELEKYGYESGEFAEINPLLWRHLFDEGLTPLMAFDRRRGEDHG